MRTLIIPCSGKSSRFKNMRPKYLLTYPTGEIMVEKCISGLNLKEFDRVIVTIVKEHSEKYESEIILSQVFESYTEPAVEICVLPEFTTCQSETVYETIRRMKIMGEIVVKDSDNYIAVSEMPHGNFIAGLNINTFPKEIFRLNSKSFIITNNQDIVTDIIEKKIKSDCICVGMYGFSDAEQFCRTYQDLLENFNFAESNEIYLSHIISYMIGTGTEIFRCLYVLDFEDWGTPMDWKIVQSKMQTYFIDLDGVIFVNRGKYGTKTWKNDNELLESNMQCIRDLYCNGAQIVVTTARSSEYVPFINEVFEKEGIKLHAIVTDCNHSSRILINDFSTTNTYPSCRAISIPRNANLNDYLHQ